MCECLKTSEILHELNSEWRQEELWVALLAISLVCLNIFLIIAVQLLECVRAYCFKG